jgi:H+-transporting ATPase
MSTFVSGYDNVEPQDTPTVWNLRVLFTVGTVLAVVACASSLLLLYVSLDSWRDGSVYDRLGIGGMCYGQITTSIFLKVAVSDFLTLFSARAGHYPYPLQYIRYFSILFWYLGESWLWTSRPSPILAGAGGLALSLSTIIGLRNNLYYR